MGWFSRKPEIKVGDTVWDSYYVSIGKPRRKVTVTRIEADGSFTFSLAYYVTTDFGYESAIPRKRSQLELVPKAQEKPYFREETPRYSPGEVMEIQREQIENQRRISKAMAKMEVERKLARIRDMRNAPKEAKDMGGELYGYPPEDDVPTTKYDVIAEREYEERIAVLERELAEKQNKNEEARREEVAKEYGIVTERCLWSVTVDVPLYWVGAKFGRSNEQKTEVLTEGRNMVEAAMAAEAMAKGIAENAHVLSIDFVRVIGALK